MAGCDTDNRGQGILIGSLGESGAYAEHGPVPMPKMRNRVHRHSHSQNAGLEADLHGLWTPVHAHSERILARLSLHGARRVVVLSDEQGKDDR